MDEPYRRAGRSSVLVASLPEWEIPAVVCKGLSKTFGEIDALCGLTLLIPRGQVFGLLGPDGAGKTTSVRLWLGLTPPTAGSAFVLGRRIPPREVLPRIGYVPQDPAIYPDLTVDENLALFGRLMGMGAEAIEDRTEDVLELVDIASRRHDLVSRLSGAIRQRTSLAAALLHDPDLLLLDEPLLGVDPELRTPLWHYLADLARRGKTVILATRHMEEAVHCDRVALLYRGQLLTCGTPSAIRERTRTANLDEAFLALLRAAREAAPGTPA